MDALCPHYSSVVAKHGNITLQEFSEMIFKSEKGEYNKNFGIVLTIEQLRVMDRIPVNFAGTTVMRDSETHCVVPKDSYRTLLEENIALREKELNASKELILPQVSFNEAICSMKEEHAKALQSLADENKRLARDKLTVVLKNEVLVLKNKALLELLADIEEKCTSTTFDPLLASLPTSSSVTAATENNEITDNNGSNERTKKANVEDVSNSFSSVAVSAVLAVDSTTISSGISSHDIVETEQLKHKINELNDEIAVLKHNQKNTMYKYSSQTGKLKTARDDLLSLRTELSALNEEKALWIENTTTLTRQYDQEKERFTSLQKQILDWKVSLDSSFNTLVAENEA